MKRMVTVVMALVFALAFASTAFADQQIIRTVEDLRQFAAFGKITAGNDGGFEFTTRKIFVVPENLRVLWESNDDQPVGTKIPIGSRLYVWWIRQLAAASAATAKLVETPTTEVVDQATEAAAEASSGHQPRSDWEARWAELTAELKASEPAPSADASIETTEETADEQMTITETTVFPAEEHVIVEVEAPQTPAIKPSAEVVVSAPVQTAVELLRPVAVPVAPEKISKLWAQVNLTGDDFIVPEGYIYFDKYQTKIMSGTTVKYPGRYYFIVAQDYENFIPTSWRDFGELQFPGTPLQRLGSTGANEVVPVHDWRKPAGRRFVVHFGEPLDCEPGTIVNAKFTGWVN